MKLDNIKEMSCPICGEEIIAEERRFNNIKGEYLERRAFACGKILRYSPVYKQIETIQECTRTPEDKEINVKRDKLRKKLVEIVMDEKDIDEWYRENLLSSISLPS